MDPKRYAPFKPVDEFTNFWDSWECLKGWKRSLEREHDENAKQLIKEYVAKLEKKHQELMSEFEERKVKEKQLIEECKAMDAEIKIWTDKKKAIQKELSKVCFHRETFKPICCRRETRARCVYCDEIIIISETDM